MDCRISLDINRTVMELDWTVCDEGFVLCGLARDEGEFKVVVAVVADDCGRC